MNNYVFVMKDEGVKKVVAENADKAIQFVRRISPDDKIITAWEVETGIDIME